MSEIVEHITEVCGLYFRAILLENAGDRADQHAHDHDHATYCGSGGAQYFVNGRWQRDVMAGEAIEVKAGMMHSFVALKSRTRLTCIHDLASAQSIKEKGL